MQGWTGNRRLGWETIQEEFMPLYSLPTKQQAEGLLFRELELEELWTQGSGITQGGGIIQKMRIE